MLAVVPEWFDWQLGAGLCSVGVGCRDAEAEGGPDAPEAGVGGRGSARPGQAMHRPPVNASARQRAPANAERRKAEHTVGRKEGKLTAKI